MAFAPQKGDLQISPAVFGGLVSEMAAPDLPEGVSPDCSDAIFQPGSVASREALQKVFAAPFPGLASVVYAKSYVGPTGGIHNLYLDSNNILWVEENTIHEDYSIRRPCYNEGNF